MKNLSFVNPIDVYTLNTFEGTQFGVYAPREIYRKGSGCYVFDERSSQAMIYESLRDSNQNHYPPVSPVWWRPLVITATHMLNMRRDIITPAAFGDSVFTLTEAPIQYELTRLEVNGRTWSYGREYIIGNPTPTSLRLINPEYSVEPGDFVEIIYFY